MRSPAIAASVALLALALSACSAPTGPGDDRYLLVSTDDLESTSTTGDGRTLLESSAAGYTLLLEPDAPALPQARVAAMLHLERGCLVAAVDGDRRRLGVVLDAAVGMGPTSLVIDGATLRFGEPVDVSSALAPPVDEAPASYRVACPDVTRLLSIGP